MLTVTEGAFHDWANMPLLDMAYGNAMDTDFTLRSWKILKKDMTAKCLNPVYDNLIKDITLLLGDVEDRGISVDQEYLKVLDEKLAKTLEVLHKELNELCPLDEDLNPNSNQQLGKLLFGEEGFGLIPQDFSLKTKAPSITEEHLNNLTSDISCSQEAKDFVKKLLEYKSKTKQYKTYVKGVEAALGWNEDGRIYSNYNFTATVTGRLSCSKYSAGRTKDMSKGVSFHTLPRPTADSVNIRNLMKADKGKAFITADFSTAELRVLAQCCRDENLIHAFQSGQDLHKYTASLIYGKPPEDITKDERQIAKSCSFLIVYGGGPTKLAQQTGKTVDYCKSIFAAYQDSFPKVFEWIKFVHKFIRKNECAISLFGRRRHLSNVKSPIKKYQFRALRQGMNFVIQSSASDMMLHALKRLDKSLKDKGYDAEILATVHDSVEIQCDYSIVKEVSELVKRELTDTSDLERMYHLKFKVPFEVDVEVGKAFGDGIEVEFSKAGEMENLKEIMGYVQDA